MQIVIISDTHTLHDDVILPEGDMLIHGGDLCGCGTIDEAHKFDEWMKKQPFKHKIVIAGNHDWYFEKNHISRNHFSFTYLQDDFVVIEGIKIYGSPWQPAFCNWAFNLPRGGRELKEKWGKIPNDTDILITHGPPLGYGDLLDDGENIGCNLLLEAVKRVKPSYHIFGHIHSGYGIYSNDDTQFMNASICTEAYKPTNKPFVIEMDSK